MKLEIYLNDGDAALVYRKDGDQLSLHVDEIDDDEELPGLVCYLSCCFMFQDEEELHQLLADKLDKLDLEISDDGSAEVLEL